MWFTVNKFDHGCCGRKYPTMLDAIKDDAWSPWDEERVRKAHNFGKGTMKDHYRHNLMNAKVIVTESEFWNMTACLGDEWRARAEDEDEYDFVSDAADWWDGLSDKRKVEVYYEHN